MPKITSETSNAELREIAEADVNRIKKTIQKDPNGLEYTFNEEGQCFTAIDKDGKEWIMGIDSAVKGYWHYCPEMTGHNSKGYELKCRTPHFVFIYQDGEKLTCRKCKKENTIELVLPE